MAFRKFVSLAAVILSSVAVIATSQQQYNMDRGDFDVKSDCIIPTYEGVVTVMNYQIIAPAGLNYGTLGFPSSVVVPNQDSIGVSGGITRNCRTTYSNEVQGNWIFNCFDNGNLTCSIYMKQR